MLTKQPVSTVSVGNERKEAREEEEKKKSISDQVSASIIQKKHNTETSIAAPANAGAFIFLSSTAFHSGLYQLYILLCTYKILTKKTSYLTSCFLGSKMLSSLSAYTFFEAVKRMI